MLENRNPGTKAVLALLAVSLVAVLVIVASAIMRDDESTPLADIETECSAEGLATLNESGTTLRFHFDGEHAPRQELRCALDVLGFPDDLDEDFPHGGGAVEWDGLTLVWSLTADGQGPVAISRME